MTTRFDKVPVLGWNHEYGQFSMRLPGTNSDDFSYEMLVDTCYGKGDDEDTFQGRYTYVFLQHDDIGDWHEMLTTRQYGERLTAIEEYEGKEAAELWHLEQEQVVVVHDNHPVFKLRAVWEAMMTLNLFDPQVTLFSKSPTKPVSAELAIRMGEACDKWMAQMEEDDERVAEHDKWMADSCDKTA